MIRSRMLLWLLGFNLAASTLHFGDNMLFFESYPEPDWITSPLTVDLLWIVMTFFLASGYWLSRNRPSWPGFVLLVVYVLMSISVFGHYLYAAPSELPFRVNFFIALEAFAALSLGAAVVTFQIVPQAR